MASQRDAFGKTSYSRFEDLFAASPRAKEIFASASKKPKNEPKGTKAYRVTQSFERSNSSSNLEANLHLQSPPFKSKYEAGKIIKNLPDQPKECNSGVSLTEETPELIGNNVVSKTVKQKQDSFSGNDMFFGIRDDDIIDTMDTLTRNVAIVLKKLDKAKKVGSVEKVNKEVVKKEQILYNWSLRTVETNDEKQIIVEGHRRGDPEKQNWRSTVICKRISSQTVMTKSGSLYCLSGKIDVEQMVEKGFSKQLINAFKSGFPRNWERLLQSHLKDVQSLEKKPGHVVSEKKRSPQKKLNVRRSARGQNKKQNDKPVNDKTGKMKTSVKVKTSEKMKTSEKDISKHRQNNSLTKSGFKTPPTSVFPKDAEVKRSRSGRIIAPPLEYWRGQRMIGSNLDDTISIVQSHLEENSVQFVKRPTPLSKFWKDSLKNKKESVKGQSRKRVSTGLTFTADSMTTDYLTSSGSVDGDYQPITTIVKTLTYASTDSTPPEDYNVPRKISKKEHQTSEKSNEYETETNETLGQSNKLRSEIAKEFGQQNKKTKTSNSTEKEAPPLVELRASQEEMVTSGGVTEDDHHESEDAPQRMYSLRSREKKVDSSTDIVSKLTVSKFARNASTTSGRRSQRRGRPSKPLDSNNNKVEVLRTRNRNMTRRLSQKGVTTTTEGMEKKASGSSCVKVIDTTTKRQNNEDIDSSETECRNTRNIKLKNIESSDTEVGEMICGRSDAESKDERSKGGGRLNSKTASDHQMVVGEVDTSETESNENDGKIGGKKLREKHSVLLKYMPSSKDKDISDSVQLSKTSKNTNIITIVAQKARTNKNIGKKSANDQLCDHVLDDEVWSENENGRLIHAVNQVPPTAAMYWQMVAQLVKTRSAEECQRQIQNDKGSKRPKKKISQKIQGKPVLEKLTAKVGTLARKRQLRDILEQQDDGYEDDLFDSTPFRNQGLIKFSPVNFDDEDFVAEDVDTDPAKYKTPSSRTPMNRLRPAGPLSASGTSETEHISPALLKTFNRNEVDRYVHQLKKRKVGCRNPKQSKSHTPVPKKISAPHPLPFDANDCFDIREDSCTEKEEDEDYYWSDV